ncbi:MAG: hypothetical protein J4G13_11850 [Dehalococcoidia bacterium]|nr:hypothetical protein [Dehalococcoidia bacterium]
MGQRPHWFRSSLIKTGVPALLIFTLLLLLPAVLTAQQQSKLGNPTNLQASPAGPSQVKATWQAAQNAEVHYVWSVRPDGAGGKWTAAAATAGSTTIDGLSSGQLYWFIALAGGNVDGEWQWSQYSNWASATTETVRTVSKIYWTDWSVRTPKIQRANLDGSEVETLIASDVRTQRPWGIALDAQGGKMYWSHYPGENTRDLDKIMRSNLDGTEAEVLVHAEDGLRHPQSLALDLAAEKIYWTEESGSSIRRANLDGTQVEAIADEIVRVDYGDRIGRLNLDGIALDLTTGKMYIAGTDLDHVRDSGQFASRIRRANLDGSGVEDLVTGLHNVRGLALDLPAGMMYWTEGGALKVFEDLNNSVGWADDGTAKIQRAGLDGSGVQDLLTSEDGLHRPNGVALDTLAGKMYWTTEASGFVKFRRANTDGTSLEDLVSYRPATAPQDIAILSMPTDLP